MPCAPWKTFPVLGKEVCTIFVFSRRGSNVGIAPERTFQRQLFQRPEGATDFFQKGLSLFRIDEHDRGSSAVVQLGRDGVDAPVVTHGEVALTGKLVEQTLAAAFAQDDVSAEAAIPGSFRVRLPVHGLPEGVFDDKSAFFSPALFVRTKTDAADGGNLEVFFQIAPPCAGRWDAMTEIVAIFLRCFR